MRGIVALTVANAPRQALCCGSVNDQQRQALEEELSRTLDGGDVGVAATCLIKGYGPEILGFLVATMRDESAGEDVFSLFCEHVLKGLPTFARRSSFRTWSYTLARHAAYHYRQQKRRRSGREVGFSTESPVSAVAAHVRSETAAHLRTEVKSRFAALRDALPEDDRTLLILRVDKNMEWLDIAGIMLAASDEGAGASAPAAADLKREAARLRKRFQLVKERIVELGKKEGLLP